MSTCPAEYRPMRLSLSGPIPEPLRCLRDDLDDQGRHRGRHHAWENMPAGVHGGHVPDPDRPGWNKWDPEAHRYDAWQRLWTWEAGGASGSARRDDQTLLTCPECGTPGYQEDETPTEAILYTGAPDAYAVAGQTQTACYHCRLWAERAREYAAGWLRSKRGGRTRYARLRRTDGTPSERLSSWAVGVTGAFGDRHYTVRWDDGEQVGPASSLWDCGAIPWWLDDTFPPNAVTIDAAGQPAGSIEPVVYG